jgi:UDP-N-acetylmuramate-alanine ligase
MCCSSPIATRTQALMDDFASAFHQADTVHLVDIYAASEQPIEGVTAGARRAYANLRSPRRDVRRKHGAGIESVLRLRMRATRSSHSARETFRKLAR